MVHFCCEVLYRSEQLLSLKNTLCSQLRHGSVQHGCYFFPPSCFPPFSPCLPHSLPNSQFYNSLMINSRSIRNMLNRSIKGHVPLFSFIKEYFRGKTLALSEAYSRSVSKMLSLFFKKMLFFKVKLPQVICYI